jgi:phage gpG-like protein
MRVGVKVTGVKLATGFTSRTTQAAEAAARSVFPELNSAFQAAINAPVWDWPRTTYRGGTYRRDGSRTKGKEVGSPRNIVDNGTLRASNSFTVNGLTATFKWSVGYATAVHYGANIHPWGDKDRPKVNLPARPWTSAVLGVVKISDIEEYDYNGAFNRAFIREWNKIK